MDTSGYPLARGPGNRLRVGLAALIFGMLLSLAPAAPAQAYTGCSAADHWHVTYQHYVHHEYPSGGYWARVWWKFIPYPYVNQYYTTNYCPL